MADLTRNNESNQLSYPTHLLDSIDNADIKMYEKEPNSDFSVVDMIHRKPDNLIFGGDRDMNCECGARLSLIKK